MSIYLAYNAALAVVVLPACHFLLPPRTRRAHALVAGRVAVLLTLVAYPWDFFAIQLGTWTYPRDPGPRLYGVPFNDLIFIWLCTYMTCCALLRLRASYPFRDRHTKSEHTDEENARQD